MTLRRFAAFGVQEVGKFAELCVLAQELERAAQKRDPGGRIAQLQKLTA